MDVHAHLIHEKFIGIEDQVALKCRDAGLEYVIVNGLGEEYMIDDDVVDVYLKPCLVVDAIINIDIDYLVDPISNRAVLALCDRHSPYLLPAAGMIITTYCIDFRL